ncbi:sacsin N-terminal ATP-binding-like domain-containing protein [Poseidonibacter antarcticus]|uniref:sacsin N-terminal ATP-binding-like domain-containing protein n=1 Tax=Poseidonibacter antarcticus TaxID=2478538 RepID=UPI000EF5389F|nr:hypothetical protein [Poseidonibacter antarcticus]
MSNKKILELYNKRQLWVDSTKDNNFDAGINNLLTELYPDNAHFIYELLQNAEDAQATEVSFELKQNELKFSHNGRVFEDKDLEGITSIGQGTKANDINKIGKFGVGFKAVFTYTNSPKIYSGKYNFEINDLVVPIEITPLDRHDSSITIMIFPFNNIQKSKTNAFSEIQKGLLNIQDNTLLFLNNIQKIIYRHDDKSNTLAREEITPERVFISNQYKKTSSKWLRFKKYLPNSETLFVSTAFKLEVDEKTQREITIPINGKVSIYFPAEKESSKLKFHIHAPFASTVARDSIKNLEENSQLRDLISELIIESIEYMKKNDYLDFNFLQVLPIHEDNLEEFYEPILLEIIDTFNWEPYVLTENKNFMPANMCYRASSKIKKLISEDDLQYIIDEDNSIYWARNPSQLNSREDKFLKQLEIKSITDEDFIDTIDNHICEEGSINKLFLKDKDNEWFKKFYELLYDINIKMKYNIIDSDLFKSVIKLKNGKVNFEQKNCFFESTSKYINKNYIVEPLTYLNSSKSRGFLELLDVKTIDLQEEIKLILDHEAYNCNYYENNNSKVSKVRHLEHWNLFLEYFRTGLNNLDLFKNKTILFNNQNKLVNANKILFSKPYIDNDLNFINGIDGCYTLHECYKELSSQKFFLEFIKKMGVLTTIPIKKQYIYWEHPDRAKIKEYGNESDYTIDEDFDIEDLSKLFKEPKYEISLILWQTIIASDENKQLARYRRIKTSSLNSAPSSLIYNLKEIEWIPDKNNVFHKPADIEQNMLPKEFIYDDSKGWMTAIGFGENIKRNQEEYKKTDKIIQDSTGYSRDLLEDAQNAGITPEKLKKFINQEKNISRKDDNPNLLEAMKSHDKDIEKREKDLNPSILEDQKEYIERSKKKLQENLQKSNQEIRKKHSSSKIKFGLDETKNFLAKEYHGYCQICGFTFDKKDNQGKYFEIFDWLSQKITKQSSNIIESGSSLCLCSRCHSILKYGDYKSKFLSNLEKKDIDLSNFSFDDFCKVTTNETKEIKIPECYDFIEMDMYKIPIRLLNKDEYIFYTEEHFSDFFNLMCLKN